MADAPKIDLEIKDTAKMELTIKDTSKIDLTNPYKTVNQFYELVANKITDMNMEKISPEAYPTVNAVIDFVQNKTDSLAEISNNAMQLANQNSIQTSEQERKLNTKENLSDKVQDISNNLSPEKYPSTVAVFDFGISIQNSCYSFTYAVLNDKLGNLEAALSELHAYAQRIVSGGETS